MSMFLVALCPTQPVGQVLLYLRSDYGILAMSLKATWLGKFSLHFFTLPILLILKLFAGET